MFHLSRDEGGWGWGEMRKKLRASHGMCGFNCVCRGRLVGDGVLGGGGGRCGEVQCVAVAVCVFWLMWLR